MADLADIAQEQAEFMESLRVTRGAAYPSATHCDDCDTPIAEARRAAVPGCRLCPDCAADAELRSRIARGGRA